MFMLKVLIDQANIFQDPHLAKESLLSLTFFMWSPSLPMPPNPPCGTGLISKIKVLDRVSNQWGVIRVPAPHTDFVSIIQLTTRMQKNKLQTVTKLNNNSSYARQTSYSIPVRPQPEKYFKYLLLTHIHSHRSVSTISKHSQIF